MTQFRGFETKESAKKFIKDNGGGVLLFHERTPKRRKLTARGREYMFCVVYGGLDENKYPFAVTWNI